MSFSDPNAREAKTDFPISKILEDQTPKEAMNSSIATKTPEESDQLMKPTEENGNEDQGEEEGECGFCLFMKAGGCRESFIAWENCIQMAENNNEDIVEKCFEVTRALTKCMEAHPDYYQPILQAERAAKEEAIKELGKEKGTKDSESNVAEKETERFVHSKDREVKEGSSDK